LTHVIFFFAFWDVVIFVFANSDIVHETNFELTTVTRMPVYLFEIIKNLIKIK
jgi:hypothetical protein